LPHRFAVTVHTSADVNYIPFVLCGLHDLAHDGLVSLDVRPALTEYELGHNATRLDIHALGSGRRVRVLVDMKDSARDIFPRDLGRHDLIFKRTFIPEVLGAMPELDASQRARILPMTPVFPTRSRHERHRLTFELARVAHVARRIRATELRNPRQIVRRFAREAWVPARDGRRLPFIDELEYPPGPTEPYILFQTRLFDPGIEGHNPVFFASKLEVNAQRIGLIRRLQRELGPAFRGGVVDDAYARRVAPDVITPLPTRRDAFLRLIREARAVIYTRGLVESVGFRFGEFFATSRCIIAERSRVALVHAPVEGRDLLAFGPVDECLRHCREILDNPSRAEDLSRAAEAHYRAHFQPKAAVLSMLERATA
jgi:hypothetical protein